MLEIKSMSKKYGIMSIIDSITMDISDKEFVAIVGPTGCGKTTILKCIAGLVKHSGGSITLDSRRVKKEGKEIGFVFQDYSLFPWLTARENIEFGLRLGKFPEQHIEQSVGRYLQITGLEAFADCYHPDLSGGMQQKVAIARTMVTDPRLVLMDEPFASLDSLTRTDMQQFLLELWEKEKKTIVFVTHDIDEALLLADKVFV
ncbi:ABC transporter ATP-binding protein, partial [Candidatus Woesearchaeota archaeon]|nr:ABC transporter ATP-binding protein [Candidatus Woesearchaeota archaeon]